MRAIALRTLRQFWETHPRGREAEAALEAWHTEAARADWVAPSDVKAQYRNVSVLKNGRVVFNIAGNEFRLVGRINYPYRVVYVRFVGTHAEYDAIDVETIGHARDSGGVPMIAPSTSSVTVRPVRTEADYEEALRNIDALMDARAGTLDGDRLDVLVTLVQAPRTKLRRDGCTECQHVGHRVPVTIASQIADCGRGALDAAGSFGRPPFRFRLSRPMPRPAD